MDGENNGKPYEQMDDLGGFPTPIFGNTQIKMNTGSVLLVWKMVCIMVRKVVNNCFFWISGVSPWKNINSSSISEILDIRYLVSCQFFLP